MTKDLVRTKRKFPITDLQMVNLIARWKEHLDRTRLKVLKISSRGDQEITISIRDLGKAQSEKPYTVTFFDEYPITNNNN